MIPVVDVYGQPRWGLPEEIGPTFQLAARICSLPDGEATAAVAVAVRLQDLTIEGERFVFYCWPGAALSRFRAKVYLLWALVALGHV